MWTSLNVNNYVLKRETPRDGIVLYVSDFTRIWSRNLNNDDIVSLCKASNPLIEAPAEKFVEKILQLIDAVSSVSKRVEESEGQLTLHLESRVGGVKFNFKIELSLQTPDLLFKKLTLPLLLLLTRLNAREKKLIDIIGKKDAEISEYKRENVSIQRSHLITKTFSLSELTEGEDEDPSLKNVANNPSLIFHLVDSSLCRVVANDENAADKTRESAETEGKITGNECDAKCRKKKRPKSPKIKNKIELQSNFLAKKRSASRLANLNL